MANPIRIKAIVNSVIAHGQGVYSVSMAPEGRVPRFKPGQFLHLTVDGYDPGSGYWPESRAFSIASSPGLDTLLIVYSVKGSYTRKMEKSLEPGREVWLKLPYGNFTIEKNIQSGQDIVLVAGGTGITPFISYLDALVTTCTHVGSIYLYYGVRLNSLMLFSPLLARCIEGISTFRANIFIENEAPDKLMLPIARKAQGRLCVDAIYEEAHELNNPIYFLSGPQPMINSFRNHLAEKRVALTNIKIDEWE